MFSSKPNYLKLRTNLRLCINRLKLLEKKKTELALKARREIADYILAGKDDRARIRVEHIIREDYLVEAMEIVEMLCDLLLARFGLIERMSELDPGIEEAVATLIWVAPRLSGDIQELREVAHQLTIKYGKEFGEMCRRNGFESVNEKVVHKMSLAAPPKILVEHYMIEIARSYKVTFEPDPTVMMGQPPEASNLIDLGVDVLASTPGMGTSAGSNAAHLKAVEAGQVAGGQAAGGGGGPGGQSLLPSIPGSIGAGGKGLGYGCSGGSSSGYTTAGANNGFPGFGGTGGGGQGGGQGGGGHGGGGGQGGGGHGGGGGQGGGQGGGHGGGGGGQGGGGQGGGQGGHGGGGGLGGGGGGGQGGGGYGYCQPSNGNAGEAGFGYGSSGGTSVGSSGVFGTTGGIVSGYADLANSSQNVAGSNMYGATGGSSSHGGGNPVYTSTGGGGAAASGINGFPGGMGSVGGITNVAGRNEADYSAALIGGVPVLPSEGQFPPPVPEGYLPPSGVLPPPPLPSHPPNSKSVNIPSSGPGTIARAPMNPQMSWINDDYLPSLPPYDVVVSSPDQYPAIQPGQRQPFGADGTKNNHLPDIPSLPDVPGLPSIPTNSLGGASVGGDDVDFDDLTRRFEELKRRK